MLSFQEKLTFLGKVKSRKNGPTDAKGLLRT